MPKLNPNVPERYELIAQKMLPEQALAILGILAATDYEKAARLVLSEFLRKHEHCSYEDHMGR